METGTQYRVPEFMSTTLLRSLSEQEQVKSVSQSRLQTSLNLTISLTVKFYIEVVNSCYASLCFPIS